VKEEWRDIEGWPSYQVSDHGRIRALAKVVPRFNPRWNCESTIHRKPRLLKLNKHHALDRKGRKRPSPPALMVRLQIQNIGKTFYVHRLVLQAFIGPCPEGYEACHEDGDPFNNRLSNLRWDTHVENIKDSIRHKTFFPKRYQGAYSSTN
jgi:hypothetical protein